jgi:hypothetical protein
MGDILCVAVWICKRQIQSFDVDRPSEQMPYFLITTDDTKELGILRRTGLGQSNHCSLNYWDGDRKDLSLVWIFILQGLILDST